MNNNFQSNNFQPQDNSNFNNNNSNQNIVNNYNHHFSNLQQETSVRSNDNF